MSMASKRFLEHPGFVIKKEKFLLLVRLMKVKELTFFGRGYLPVWMCFIEFKRVIGVREVLLSLFLYFPAGFDLIKKLGLQDHRNPDGKLSVVNKR